MFCVRQVYLIMTFQKSIFYKTVLHSLCIMLCSRKMARPPSARPAAPRVKKNDAPPDEPVIM